MVSRETSYHVELLKYQSLTLEEKLLGLRVWKPNWRKLENQVSYVYCACMSVFVCV